ncbi:MAG: Wzz/FepE/Etk N-terminal domain-containing protein, partial [Pseudomonadota bacterium]
MGDEFGLEDVLIILRRRILFFIIPVIILAPVGVAFVMLLPPKYTAEGKILVESQSIPENWAPSAIIADAQERIQTIRQRVLTRNRLLEVADKFDLFPREMGLSESERVQYMRERLTVRPITTRINRRGRTQDGTIAFTVAYEDRSPDKAFEVANEFMTSFLKEDVLAGQEAASDTTAFFEKESMRLRNDLETLETEIAKFKIENASSLPEHLNLHLDMLERASRELSTDQSAVASLQEELRFLETQLQSVISGAGVDGPGQEMTRLRSELTRLRAVYRDAHPSVQAVKDEIAALNRQLEPSGEIKSLTKELDEAREALKLAERAEERDDAVIAERRIAVSDANERLSDQFAKEASTSSGTYLSAQLQGRIAQTKNRIATLESQQQETRDQIADLQQLEHEQEKLSGSASRCGYECNADA